MKQRMMKIFCLIGCMVVLAGCGSMDSDSGNSDVQVSGNSEVVKMVSMKKQYSIEELKEKYREWFDDSGEVKYPYDLDSKEWKEEIDAKGGLDYSLFDIPKEIVDNLDTEHLFRAVEAWPPLLIYTENTLSDADSYYSSMFYGFKILRRRKDCYQVAWNVLKKRYEDFKNDAFTVGKELRRIELAKIRYEESLVLTKSGYESMTKHQRKEVWNLIDKMEKYMEEADIPLEQTIFYYKWESEK